MGYAAKWWGLVAATAVMVPFAEMPGFLGESYHLMPAALAQSPNSSRQAEADRLLQQAFEQYQASQFPEAVRFLEQALAIYRDIGNRAGEATALSNLGTLSELLGDYSTALNYSQQSLVVCQI